MSGPPPALVRATKREPEKWPTIRFIPVNSVELQRMLCVQRLSEGLKDDRTACINRIRGLLAEFGLAFSGARVNCKACSKMRATNSARSRG